MLANSLIELDRDHYVHPVSAYRAHEARGALVLESAKGMFIRDAQGRSLLDAFAGLWCVNIGYGHESVVEAAAAQMRKLPYATGYFGFASEPTIRLAAKLAEIAPPGLSITTMRSESRPRSSSSHCRRAITAHRRRARA